jgi:hypothetical protein
MLRSQLSEEVRRRKQGRTFFIDVPFLVPVGFVTENGKEAGRSFISDSGGELLLEAFLFFESWLLLGVTWMERRRAKEKDRLRDMTIARCSVPYLWGKDSWRCYSGNPRGIMASEVALIGGGDE